ncbi:hypothetical protein ACOMHN_064768 [Nucella lapillus]
MTTREGGRRGRTPPSPLTTTSPGTARPRTIREDTVQFFSKIFTPVSRSQCCQIFRGSSWFWVFLLFLLFLDVGVHGRASSPGQGRSSPSRPRPHPRPGRLKDEDPLARLSRVFGIKRIPAKVVHRTPPQYMTELYKEVADKSGLTKASGPYNANTVRSFPDRDAVHQEHYFYNLSHLAHDGAERERVLEAEFHVFKMKPRPARSADEPLPPHHLQLKVYQVLNVENMHTPEGLRLLDSRRISTHAHGWLTFKVSKAVGDWLSGPDTNYGLLVMVQSVQGQVYNHSSYVRFAQRHQHHDSKQPILVVFTDDAASGHPTFVSPDDQDYKQIRKEMLERNRKKAERRRERQARRGRQHKQQGQGQGSSFSSTPNFRQAVSQLNERGRSRKNNRQPPDKVTKRTKRAAGGKGGGGGGSGKKRRRQGRRKRMYDVGGYRYRRSCARYKMYVDFEDIGWSGWIISPKGYDAYHCSGECPFPLGQSQKPTNHATVQSIVHALRVGGKHLGTPCCVPNKLFSISLLYFDDEENVILKRYDDMVAASCGCH